MQLSKNIIITQELQEIIDEKRLRVENNKLYWEEKQLVNLLLKNSEIHEAHIEDIFVFENSLFDLFND